MLTLLLLPNLELLNCSSIIVEMHQRSLKEKLCQGLGVEARQL